MCVTQACMQNWINLDKIVRGNLVCSLPTSARCETAEVLQQVKLLEPNAGSATERPFPSLQPLQLPCRTGHEGRGRLT